MNEEQFIKKLQVSAILFKYNVPVNEAKIVGAFIEELQQETQELKKQLKELEEQSSNAINKQVARGIVLINQQKEFIDWLENEIENCKYGEENYADGDDMSYHNENELRKEILSKYKEIIGEKK